MSYQHHKRDEYFGGRIMFTCNDDVKKYYTDHYNNDMKRLQMVTDFANDYYKEYHTQFKKKIGINTEPHNPTDFCAIALYTMTPSQINSIDENMENLLLKDKFEIMKTHVVDRDELNYNNTRCCCGKVINNVIKIRNKESSIAIIVGSCCVNKNKMIPDDQCKKMNKSIREQKALIKKKKKFNMCSKCYEYKIPKINDHESINSENVCIECKKEEEKQRIEEEKKRSLEEENKRKIEANKRFEEEKKRRIEDSLKVTELSTLSFGQHRGKKISEVPYTYLMWYYNENKMKKENEYDNLYTKNLINCIEKLITSKMVFGKHKDKPLSEVPISYLSWLERETEVTPYIRKIFEIKNYTQMNI